MSVNDLSGHLSEILTQYMGVDLWCRPRHRLREGRHQSVVSRILHQHTNERAFGFDVHIHCRSIVEWVSNLNPSCFSITQVETALKRRTLERRESNNEMVLNYPKANSKEFLLSTPLFSSQLECENSKQREEGQWNSYKRLTLIFFPGKIYYDFRLT
ncbi:hypothetical protein AVEN_167414-1 [Araneus ventricosus]|uniref:Uncharacterized protein n=1 Tax=Araneus ventricosus TaxID=182803 RepID=A0A4Y2TUC8_ARAVE|nr:hypothetical protein AVEN_167414-1 [Araneus ventricosus]